MTTHIGSRNTALFDMTTLLDKQLDALKSTTSQKEAGGPPGTNIQTDTTETEVTGPGQPDYALPFLNLDPYAFSGKDNLPVGDLQEGAQGGITSEVQSANGAGEQQLGFGLEMMNHTFRTSDGTLDIMTLAEERATEIKSGFYNGQEIAVEYQSGLMHAFEGNFYDNQFRQLYIEMASEVGTTIQAETFDEHGNQVLTAFGQEQMLEVYGEAFDYGIAEFEMIFELAIDIQLIDFGRYEMSLSVMFEGEIVYLNGAERAYFFEYETPFPFYFSSLDEIEIGSLPQGFYDEIARFTAGMGDAWDAVGTVSDHLESVLLQLQEDGHYQQWDDMGQGLENPFNFNLPNVDPFA
ncbi:hypothetical protein [uncultured Roseibium sp.]|uniref:hypothetical protein n=1 Tax=uncultured Roseibium sp. TaxID=1936171 RepID=UPI00262A9D45|nr:hypothetical protein [uncultured Roseibium sp.]